MSDGFLRGASVFVLNDTVTGGQILFAINTNGALAHMGNTIRSFTFQEVKTFFDTNRNIDQGYSVVCDEISRLEQLSTTH